MGQLENMALFIRIVDAGGIGKAAEQLNLAKSAVSRRLSELEDHLKTPLSHRTTRVWNLTDEGAIYYQRAKNILDDVSGLDAQIQGNCGMLTGELKVTVPHTYGQLHLAPMIEKFCGQYQQLSLNIDFSDRHIDLVTEGYELAIRIGQLKDSTLKAKKLGDIRHVIVASPDYVEAHGVPDSSDNINQHDFLRFSLSSKSHLDITTPDGKTTAVKPQGRITTNDGVFLKRMVLQGQGLCYLPLFIVNNEVEQGQLQILDLSVEQSKLGIYAVYPNNRFLSQRARLFIDFLASEIDAIEQSSLAI